MIRSVEKLDDSGSNGVRRYGAVSRFLTQSNNALAARTAFLATLAVAFAIPLALLTLPAQALRNSATRSSYTSTSSEVERRSASSTASSDRLLTFYAEPEGGGTHELYVVGEDGSGLRRLTDRAEDVFGGQWSADGQQLAFEANGEIYTTRPDGSEKQHVASGRDPVWAPDADVIAYAGSDAEPGIWLLNADGSKRTRLTSKGLQPVWSPNGRYIAFYASGADFADWNIHVYDLQNDSLWNVTKRPGAHQSPSWAPDSSRLVYTSYEDQWNEQDVYVTDLHGSSHTEISDNPNYDSIGSSARRAGQVWSATDDRILYHGRGDTVADPTHVYRVRPDGEQREQLHEGLSAAWSPGGAHIAFDGGGFIRLMNADGSNARVITPDSIQAFGPVWQPGGAVEPEPEPEPEPGDPLPRLSGEDRVETAIALSRWGFDAAGGVIIASAANFPDALAAAPLSGALNAPLLLTHRDELDEAVVGELERLGASEAWLVGGSVALSADVEDELSSKAGIPPEAVHRLAGGTRWETAAAIAEEVRRHTDPSQVLLANGGSFPDALSASAYVAELNVPVLLVQRGQIPEASHQLLASGRWENVTAVGGTAVIADATFDAAREAGGVSGPRDRLWGPDRYATSVAVADARASRAEVSAPEVVLATGINWPDALGAGPAAASRGSAFLLTPPNDLSGSVTKQWLRSNASRLESGWISGGSAAVSETVAEQAANAIR